MIVGSAAGRGAPVEQASGKGRAVDLTAGELGVDRGDSDLGVAVQVLTWLAQQYLDPDDDGPVDLWLALRSGLDVLPGCPNTPTPPSLLVAVADRLRGAVRGGDTVARLGGDEFAIVLVDASPGQVLDVVARIQRVLTGPVRVGGQSCWVGASIGVCFGVRGQDAETVLGDAAGSSMHRTQTPRHRRPGPPRGCAAPWNRGAMPAPASTPPMASTPAMASTPGFNAARRRRRAAGPSQLRP